MTPTTPQPDEPTTRRTLVIAVPRNELISLNVRAHYMAVHRQTAALVDRARMIVRAAQPEPLVIPTRLDVYVHYPNQSRRRDVANLMGTVKPLVDGMVRQGWLLDDDDEHLHGPFLHPATPDMLRPPVGRLSSLADAHVFEFLFTPWERP
jgi:hypothetical protein